MNIFDISDSPSQGTIDHKIHAHTHRQRKSILLVLNRPIAAHRIVWELAASIIPGVYQFFSFADRRFHA
jgi:hypothetical protein